MYKIIFVPVDLEHKEKLSKSLDVAGRLAKDFGATIIYASVTTAQPSAVARTPEAYQAKLAEFAEAEGARHGIKASGVTVLSHDPSIDLDQHLLEALKESGADLVVMQSHPPHITDHLWPAHGGRIATHTDVSVFLVR